MSAQFQADDEQCDENDPGLSAMACERIDHKEEERGENSKGGKWYRDDQPAMEKAESPADASELPSFLENQDKRRAEYSDSEKILKCNGDLDRHWGVHAHAKTKNSTEERTL
ncbi:hypothetical protein JRQ81_012282 [Phrynocephalus forsythii]|uniref:Uncharacterized protein n=1 Tax=Phrynocephalus forsythii TaxID=171643 RepID=A0A9Q0X7K6_9SAUR|nr:hypothetical protein JRQ81_012282 [Phrynocephalus forsythii]